MKYFRLICLLMACTSFVHAQKNVPLVLNKKFSVTNSTKLKAELDTLSLYKNSFVGLCIYDLKLKKFVTEYNADKLFIPASNMKLLSFYASLKYIGDSVPGLYYTQNKDTLIFWGSGNPCLLHYDEPDSSTFNFLKNSKGKLFFSAANFYDKPLGYAWAWDDYDSYFSAEKFSLPLYGNFVRIDAYRNGSMKNRMPYFADSLVRLPNADNINYFWATRKLHSNIFPYILPKKIRKHRERDIPFLTSPQNAVKILSAALQRPIGVVNKPIAEADSVLKLYSFAPSRIYKPLLQRSDNFYAEQILYLCADSIFGGDSLQTKSLLRHIQSSEFEDLSTAPNWVDGSGLSRHNLITPRALVEVLLKIKNHFGESKSAQDSLFSLLPAGAKRGTLKRRFKGKPTFVYAKTGTLSNNHNLSGYLVCKSGRVLVFSFMNNHYTHPLSSIVRQMDKILTDYYLHY